jgi:DNA-binding NarL/FixJ family response regulator
MNDQGNSCGNEKIIILIVEDHNELRSALEAWLQSIFYNCRFLVSESGEEALAMTAIYRPDIVLMDIQLPQMNGIETIRRIKDMRPETKAVILSVYNYPAYQQEAAAAGACTYINKHNMHIELIPTLINLLPAKCVVELNLDLMNAT